MHEVRTLMIEKDAWHINGYVGIVILAVLTLVAAWSVYEVEYWLAAICLVVGMVLSTGFAFVHPNQAMIIQFLGKYVGTYRSAGLIMFLPFSKKATISLRVKAYHSKEIIIYGEHQQRYSISLLLVYKIVDVAKAFYDIDDIDNYIDVQSEMILRRHIENKELKRLMDDKEYVQQKTIAIQESLTPCLDIAGIDLLEVQLLPSPKSIIRQEWNQEQLLSTLRQLLSQLEKNETSALSK